MLPRRDRRLRRGRAKAAGPACQTGVAHRRSRRGGRHRPPYRICGSRRRQPTSEPAEPPSSRRRRHLHNASQPPDQTGSELLTDASMLNPARPTFSTDRTWKVELTSAAHRKTRRARPASVVSHRGPANAAAKDPTRAERRQECSAALHEATAYSSSDEASQAYDRLQTLGGCVAGSYIIRQDTWSAGFGSGRWCGGHGGRGFQEPGPQRRPQPHRPRHEPGRRPAVEGARDNRRRQALGQVNSVQCGPAGGACAGTASVANGPPPLGGDEPGSWPPETFPLRGPRSPRGCRFHRAAERGVQGIPVRDERELGNRVGEVEELEGLPHPDSGKLLSA